MNILITGAAGFIGSFLCEEFIALKYKVVGVDNFFRGQERNITNLRKQENFIFQDIDLSLECNIKSMQQLILENGVQIVVHLAAINGTQYFYDRPFFVLDQNIRMTQNLLNSMLDTPVKYIVFSSSSEVYGSAVKIPTNEQQPILLNIQMDRDSYAASKVVNELYIRLFAKTNQISTLMLRIFNTYGERMIGTRYGQVIPEFVTRMLFDDKFTILGDGTHTRSFCYITDLIKIMSELIQKQTTGVINVGNNEEITILDLAKKIHLINKTSFKPEFLPERVNDHKRRQPDITLLQSIFPGLSFVSLDSGLEKVITYCKNQS